jgi:hypothetical protein
MSGKEPMNRAFKQTIFGCLPYRLGVLLTACVAWSSSVLFLASKDAWYHVFKHFNGGHTMSAKIVIGCVQYSGLLFGLVGILGAWLNRRGYVVYYNGWQVLRVVGWCVMYAFDVPVIHNCEEFVNNVSGMVEQHGWNENMFNAAMEGTCTVLRKPFFVCSSFAIIYYLYCVYATYKYTVHMDKLPKHLLRPPKDLPSSTFYSHSTGERSYMNGIWGKHDQSFSGQGPPAVPGAPGGPPTFTGAGGFV